MPAYPEQRWTARSTTSRHQPFPVPVRCVEKVLTGPSGCAHNLYMQNTETPHTINDKATVPCWGRDDEMVACRLVRINTDGTGTFCDDRMPAGHTGGFRVALSDDRIVWAK